MKGWPQVAIAHVTPTANVQVIRVHVLTRHKTLQTRRLRINFIFHLANYVTEFDEGVGHRQVLWWGFRAG
ncbi:MAG: hypothetical protein RBS68_06220 [Anaerolineales bacterium]|nr:hypothetical protein [Anaerolineales bacterium]